MSRRVLLALMASMALTQAGAQQPSAAWGEAAIRASRHVPAQAARGPVRPKWNADPLHLVVVVEAGASGLALVDGDRMDVVHRLAIRPGLVDSPKFSPDGRYAYFVTGDGWITKYDLWNLEVAAEVRAGLQTRKLALSSDGRWVIAGNTLPHTLALFDADLKLMRSFAAVSRDGRHSSGVHAVHDAGTRRSFVVMFEGLPELWEISYDPGAPPIFEGLVHDYRMGEGLAAPGYLGIRRTLLEDPLDEFFFEPAYPHVIGWARQPQDGSASVHIINLDVRRRIATLPLAGVPGPGAGASFARGATRVLALPSPKGSISMIDMATWKLVKEIPTAGPSFFAWTHEKAPHVWVAVGTQAAADSLVAIDKQTLEIAARVKPEPGQKLGHLEFTPDGRHALACLSEAEGALILYDAATAREIKRLPMRMPSGAYSVGNRIARLPNSGR